MPNCNLVLLLVTKWNKKVNQLIVTLSVVWMDYREIFEVIMLLILTKTLAKPKLGRFRNCCFGYHKMLIKVSLPNIFNSVLMILITAQTSIPKYTKILTALIHTIMLSMAKTRKGVFWQESMLLLWRQGIKKRKTSLEMKLQRKLQFNWTLI